MSDAVFTCLCRYDDGLSLWVVNFKRNDIMQKIGYFNTFAEASSTVELWCLAGKE